MCHSYGVQKHVVGYVFSYRHIMPNGIFQTANAVRHDISVASNNT